VPRKTKEKPVAVKPVSVRFNPQTLKDLEEFARENNLRTQTVIQLSVSFGWHVIKKIK
jgi:allophanate hydrolase subunit 1